MTLREHLAKGYDLYVRGASRGWTKKMFVQELQDNPDLLTEARAKLGELASVKRAMRQCEISKVQERIIADALRTIDSAP